MTILAHTVDSPVGPLTVALEDDVLCALAFGHRWDLHCARMERESGPVEEVDRPTPAMKKVLAALEKYFAGDIEILESIPARPHGTEFQQSVWKALREIGPGETMSYGELAKKIGRPAASRAVGAANGSNPVAIVIPCHRVIGKNGTLTGYGGGLPLKHWLLAHEGFPVQGELFR